VAAYVALAPEAAARHHAGDPAVVLQQQWQQQLGVLAPKTVLTASALPMLPNGKPDRLAMTAELSALHGGT
jgi:O-succinylbenzoic acid--CoA ligase